MIKYLIVDRHGVVYETTDTESALEESKDFDNVVIDLHTNKIIEPSGCMVDILPLRKKYEVNQ